LNEDCPKIVGEMRNNAAITAILTVRTRDLPDASIILLH